jgi:hypothetical protein
MKQFNKEQIKDIIDSFFILVDSLSPYDFDYIENYCSLTQEEIDTIINLAKNNMQDYFDENIDLTNLEKI